MTFLHFPRTGMTTFAPDESRSVYEQEVWMFSLFVESWPWFTRVCTQRQCEPGVTFVRETEPRNGEIVSLQEGSLKTRTNHWT